MKHNKLMLPVLAVIVGAAASAFTVIQKNNKIDDQQWYELTEGGNPQIEDDYEPVDQQPCNGTSDNVCGVQAQDDPADPGHPDLNAAHTFVYKPI